jgi:hypothetical protein
MPRGAGTAAARKPPIEGRDGDLQDPEDGLDRPAGRVHPQAQALQYRRDPGATPAPDLVNRNFHADAPDRLWVADISRIPRQDEANRGQRDDRLTSEQLEELRRLRRENAELRRHQRDPQGGQRGFRPGARPDPPPACG